MGIAASGRRHRRRVTTRCGVALAAALCLVPVAQGGEAAPLAGRGSELLGETFEGSSIADPGFEPLNSACLTGAAGAPPAGASATGPCTGAGQTEGPVPTPGVTPGWLQLTDSGGFHKGGLLYNRPLPGNGGLQVTFEQYQYGGTGADGIGFFLVDGATDLTSAGGDGGSLGYAQRNLDPGVDGGYLGIGLDAYGNFVNDGEQRGLNCPADQKSPVNGDAQVPNTVALRGPGQGIDGYCFLTATIEPDAGNLSGQRTTLPGPLRQPGSNPETAKRTVRLTVSPEPLPLVTVEIDFNDGAGFQQVLSYRMKVPAPPTYKFGFSGSTGGGTDVHLIRGLTGRSVDPLSTLNLVKTVASAPPGGGTEYAVGDTVDYRFLVTNTSGDSLHDVVVTDPEITDIQCPSTTLGPMGTPTASMECTGSYVITGADANVGTFTNTATANGKSTGGADVPSNESSATVDVTKPNHRLTITKTSDATGPVAPGSTVNYTVTVRNSGTETATAATVTDDLTGVLDDATYNDDADSGGLGTVTYAEPELTWTGDLTPGQTATITYSVTVHDPVGGDGALTNTVAGPDGSNCPADAPNPECTTDVPMIPPPTNPPPTTAPPTTAPPTTGPTTAPPTASVPPTAGPSPSASAPHGKPLASTGFGYPAMWLALSAALLVGLGVLARVWTKRPRRH